MLGPMLLLLLAPSWLRHYQVHRHVHRQRSRAIELHAAPTDGLPISPLLPEIVGALEKEDEPNLVLQAPPGAGKTSSVPLSLLEAPWREADGGTILVLEPRRVAARSAAQRMASLLGERVGERVGYSFRGERAVSRHTRVLCVTEGVLVRRLQNDPELRGVAAVCFDEFHERSVDGDLCLALCREIQVALRPSLRLLVMSATLGGDLAPRLSALLGNCRIFTSEGRSFPVTIRQCAARPRSDTRTRLHPCPARSPCSASPRC